MRKIAVIGLLVGLGQVMYANVPGGGDGSGPNVSLVDGGTTMTLGNGIVSFKIEKGSGHITQFNYDGVNLLAGGAKGGFFYHDWTMAFGTQGTSGTLSVVVDPASNGGDYGEVRLAAPWNGSATQSAMDVDLYYSLGRGNQGLYTTAVLSHPAAYPLNQGGEWRSNIYIGSIFDWLCVDPYRNRQMASPSDAQIAVPGAPKEVSQFTTGIRNGQYECKYSYSASLGDLDVYGWASSSKHLGIWMTLPSHEYYSGGPMKRELTGHLGNTLLNMFGGQHYGMGSQMQMPPGVDFQKTYGPYFIYFNKYAGAAADPIASVSQTLWADAKAQAQAEKQAWPYAWFQHSFYAQRSARATVLGRLGIQDPYQPNASPAGLWIGLAPDDGGTEFQQQSRSYQFWVKSGPNGSFSIPNVLAGNYNLWAFGPGAAGTFKRTGIQVAPGQRLDLGALTWTPSRLGATVWEIGIPDRDSKEFLGGDSTPGQLPDYARWGGYLDYGARFPTGIHFNCASGDPHKDWFYCQPVTQDPTGAYIGTASKLSFNLAQAPTAAQKARFYIAFAASKSAAFIVKVNGSLITPGAGSFPSAESDALIRLGSQGAWSDRSIDFSGDLLKQGNNEIEISLRPAGTAGIANGFEYDYLRLELQGLTPPATPVPSPVNTGTARPTGTATPFPSSTRSASPTPSPSATPSATRSAVIIVTASATPSPTASASAYASFSPSLTASFSSTPRSTPTSTATASPRAMASSTASATHTATPSRTPTCTPSRNPSPRSSVSPSATLSASFQATKTSTAPANASRTPSATQTLTPQPVATAAIRVDYKPLNVAVSSSGLQPRLRLYNTGTSGLLLDGVTLRYWFKQEPLEAPLVDVYDVRILPSGLSVQPAFLASFEADARGGQTHALKLSFGSGAGSLPAGAYVEIQLQIHTAGWQTYDQTNDYSYAPWADYQAQAAVVAYVQGLRVWGNEPGSALAPGGVQAASLKDPQPGEPRTSDGPPLVLALEAAPNPATGGVLTLYFLSSASTDRAKVEVFNSALAKVATAEWPGPPKGGWEHASLDLSSLPNGYYRARLTLSKAGAPSATAQTSILLLR